MAIYGECERSGQKQAVEIRDLAETGCKLTSKQGAEPLAGELLLWIGAIGPLEVTASGGGKADLAASFKQPLDPRIIQHFADD